MKTKPAIAMTTAIMVSVVAAGLALAQNPTIIQSTRSTMNGVSNNAAAASNAALSVHESAPSAASARARAKSSATVAAPAKTSPVRTISVSAKAPSAKKKDHEKRGGAVLVTPIAPPAPSPVPEETASAPVDAGGASGSEGENAASEQEIAPDSKYSANGRRDPFISPVVSHAGGSGCSTGKKCLEIGAINLRGVVHMESGFIAVVSNGLNKAYFLRENDPVFNGYVVRITGDSIVFQETLQDRLGKTFTREVVKKITAPAV